MCEPLQQYPEDKRMFGNLCVELNTFPNPQITFQTALDLSFSIF